MAQRSLQNKNMLRSFSKLIEAAKNKKSKILKNPRKKPNLTKKGKSKPTPESSDSEESSIAIQPSSDEDDEEASYLGPGDEDFVFVSYGLKKYPGANN
jgi:hypothetical protein